VDRLAHSLAWWLEINKISAAKSAAQTTGSIYKSGSMWKDLEHPKYFNQTRKTMQKPLFRKELDVFLVHVAQA